MSPKLIKKLADKKYRTETGLFLVEGAKNIHELLSSDFVIESICGTEAFLDDTTSLLHAHEKRGGHMVDVVVTNEADLARMGTLESNNAGIAVVVQKVHAREDSLLQSAKDGFVLVLDDVRDPGNLGTIMRIADWYGVRHIVASPSTTDCYNPKVISASMGSFTRVSVIYLPLDSFVGDMSRAGIPIMGAVFDGKNIHDGGLPRHGALVMGSESHGISPDLLPHLTEKLTIPKYGGAESLNVSIATGILLDALRRIS
jgi:TrmH family RNA methyltransferase